jgi:hypothetical protein
LLVKLDDSGCLRQFSKKVCFDANGEVLPEPISSSDIRSNLPEEI